MKNNPNALPIMWKCSDSVAATSQKGLSSLSTQCIYKKDSI